MLVDSVAIDFFSTYPLKILDVFVTRNKSNFFLGEHYMRVTTRVLTRAALRLIFGQLCGSRSRPFRHRNDQQSLLIHLGHLSRNGCQPKRARLRKRHRNCVVHSLHDTYFCGHVMSPLLKRMHETHGLVGRQK